MLGMHKKAYISWNNYLVYHCQSKYIGLPYGSLHLTSMLRWTNTFLLASTLLLTSTLLSASAHLRHQPTSLRKGSRPKRPRFGQKDRAKLKLSHNLFGALLTNLPTMKLKQLYRSLPLIFTIIFRKIYCKRNAMELSNRMAAPPFSIISSTTS